MICALVVFELELHSPVVHSDFHGLSKHNGTCLCLHHEKTGTHAHTHTFSVSVSLSRCVFVYLCDRGSGGFPFFQCVCVVYVDTEVCKHWSRHGAMTRVFDTGLCRHVSSHGFKLPTLCKIRLPFSLSILIFPLYANLYKVFSASAYMLLYRMPAFTGCV